MSEVVNHPYEPGGPVDAEMHESLDVGYTGQDHSDRITPQEVEDRPFVGPTPFKMPEDYTKTPPRQWLYDKSLMRKLLSVDVAPGGLGKSTLSVAEAIDMVIGGGILGPRVPYPLNVWIFNLEDPREIVEQAVVAALIHHGIDPKKVEGRLFIDSGRDQQFKLGVQGREGAHIQTAMRDRMIEFMLANKIDVLIIDPFVSSHEVTENDNNAIDMIAKEWGYIAEKTNAAIRVVHHSRKQNGEAEITTESSRGGKGLTDAARVTRVFNRMTEDEAEKAGVDNYRSYFRVYIDKGNLAPPAEKSDWYHLTGFDYGNADEHFESDNVGVVERWEWPTPKHLEDLTPRKVYEIQKALDDGPNRESSQSKEWAGHTIADILDKDSRDKDAKRVIAAILKHLVSVGALKISKVKDKRSEWRPVYIVGEWQNAQTEVFQ